MPFIRQIPRAFTQDEIESLNPNQSGIYGLFKPGTWIYVGKGDIKQRLLAHFNGDNPCITRLKPTHWVAEVINGDPSIREKQLTSELPLACNKKIG